jgi:hypothetical protein
VDTHYLPEKDQSMECVDTHYLPEKDQSMGGAVPPNLVSG